MSDFEKVVLKTLSELKQGQEELRGNVGELRGNVGELRKDVGDLREDVGDLREDVGELRKDVGELKGSVRRLEVLHEQTAEKIDQIIEAVSPEMVKGNNHAAMLADHEERITFVENVQKMAA